MRNIVNYVAKAWITINKKHNIRDETLKIYNI